MKFEKIKIHAFKNNDYLYKKWWGYYLLEENDKFILLVSKFSHGKHNNKRISINKKTVWYFPKDKWFNVMITFSDENKFLKYYFNIASLVKNKNNIIEYIDYDLDIKIDKYYNFKILDLKEFNVNRIKFNYTKEIINNCWITINNIIVDIKLKKDFFKDFSLMKYEKEIMEIFTS